MSNASSPGSSAPLVTIQLSISPSSHSLQSAEPPTLLITALLQADRPITVLTWPTILNPGLAMKRKNFWADDITSGKPVPVQLELTKGPKRAALQRRRDHPDEQYYLTLPPQTPVTVSHPFSLVNRIRNQDQGVGLKDANSDEACSKSVMEPGHRYRFGVAREEGINKWWWGTRDEVLTLPGSTADATALEGGVPIVFGDVAPAEIELLE